LIVASLQRTVEKMSFLQQVPESLKLQECEHGSSLNPSIPYIPEKYEDSDTDCKVPTIKYELANGVETRTNVWDGVGRKEQFLCHTVAIWEALQGVGLVKKHEEAENKVLEVKEELKWARESHDLMKQQVEICKSETKREPLRGELTTLETQIKACKAAVASAKMTQITTMVSIFSMATIFLCGDGKTLWDRIVTKQTKKEKWKHLCSLKHEGPCSKTMAAFEDCMMLILKTVFANNVAEDMKFYMT
jgi:hypothetical protein